MTADEARGKIEEFRVLVDEVDRRIVALLNERTRVVEDIGCVKREARLPIYEPKREDQVFANVSEVNHGPLSEEAVRRIFERIIDEMRTIQRLRMESGAGLPACPADGEK
jgi:chorismate mutase